MSRPLTHFQVQALGAIGKHDGVTPSQIADDLLVSISSARTAGMALEQRGLVASTYSGVRGGRGYVVTDAGRAELEAWFGDDAP